MQVQGFCCLITFLFIICSNKMWLLSVYYGQLAIRCVGWGVEMGRLIDRLNYATAHSRRIFLNTYIWISKFSFSPIVFLKTDKNVLW